MTKKENEMWIERDFRDIERWIAKNKNVPITTLSMMSCRTGNGLNRILDGKFSYATFKRVMKFIKSHPKVQ